MVSILVAFVSVHIQTLEYKQSKSQIQSSEFHLEHCADWLVC